MPFEILACLGPVGKSQVSGSFVYAGRWVGLLPREGCGMRGENRPRVFLFSVGLTEDEDE